METAVETAPSPVGHRGVGAMIGLACGAIAIGVAHLAAGLIATGSSPVLAVGAAAIDLSPAWLKRFAIQTFGAQDKRVLLGGIAVVLAIGAVCLGIASIGRPWVGIWGLVALGTVGAVAALARPDASWAAAIPAVVGTLAALAAYRSLRRRAGLTVPRAGASSRATDEPPATPTGYDRRRFLAGSGAVVGLAVATGFVGDFLVRRADASASRASVRLPGTADAAPPTPPGADLRIPGTEPFLTPNDDFYRVDTALFVPSVRAEDWTLTIGGMVDRPLTIDFDTLAARPLIERDITLTCISNEIGGEYLGNARWTGVRLADLLGEAGVRPGVTQLVSRSADGFTTGTPAAVALDGRDAMLAIAMNGEPLPLAHGFPVRMVIPGLYGYASACKWIVSIEATTWEAYSAYWVKRGWAEDAPIETGSRIDTPRRGAALAPGRVPVAGIAWAQHRGIAAVEVQVDRGPWMPARLGEEDTADTWRQWVFDWDAAPGVHTITARATDGAGAVQTDEVSAPFPDGATGLHAIEVSVSPS